MDFSDVSKTDLSALIDALESRLGPPYSEIGLKRIVSTSSVAPVAANLSQLHECGFEPPQIAILLKTVLAERIARPQINDLIDLVTTGPEAPGIANRDTAVVVRNIFSQAKESVLVVGYAVYQGRKVFEALANRMTEVPELNVRMCLNLSPEKETTVESLVVRRFAEKFKSQQWPTGCRLPEIFYDPRSIAPNPSDRASLHAKCIVVDHQEVFISSANFTDRAHHRNIEVGLRISSKEIADQLTKHFAALVSNNFLKPAIW